MKKLAACLFILLFYHSTSAQVNAYQAGLADTTRVFTKAEVSPVFKGGAGEWVNYIRNNLNGRIGADNGAPVGTYQVMVIFIINDNGIVRDVAAQTNFGYGMEQEAIRVIKNSPAWTPARQNGYTVNFYYRQPISFVVSLDGINISAPPEIRVDKENEVEVYADKVPVEFIEFEITNGNGTVSPSGKGKFIFKPSKKGSVLADLYIHSKRKKKKVTAVYFKAE